MFDVAVIGNVGIDTNVYFQGSDFNISEFYLEKLSVEESICRGKIVARHTCSQKANTSNLLTKPRLDKLLSDIFKEA